MPVLKCLCVSFAFVDFFNIKFTGILADFVGVRSGINFLFARRPIHSKLDHVNLNPEKLLLSKWTTVNPQAKEKHFLVVRVINPETERHKIEEVEMEAVMTRRRFVLKWEELTDATKWAQGWL